MPRFRIGIFTEDSGTFWSSKRLMPSHLTADRCIFGHMLIDSHHHLWRYDPHQYAWIADENLRRDFWIAELQDLAEANDVDRFVTVQARETIAETETLVELAEHHRLIAGVVGWMPMDDPAIDSQLEKFADRHHLVGLRSVLQDLDTADWWLSDAFGRGLRACRDAGLTYDLLIRGRQLRDAVTLVDRHRELRFVVDHIAKPTIASTFDRAWQTDLAELAKRPHILCKWSGVTTEVRSGGWDVDTIRPYFDAVVAAFGPDRMMYGSDWPVCLMATEYSRWLKATKQLTADWSDDDREKFYARNAASFYGLDLER